MYGGFDLLNGKTCLILLSASPVQLYQYGPGVDDSFDERKNNTEYQHFDTCLSRGDNKNSRSHYEHSDTLANYYIGHIGAFFRGIGEASLYVQVDEESNEPDDRTGDENFYP